MEKQFVVYMLRCVDDSYYVGVTSNLEHRLEEHIYGTYPACYTFSKRPIRLVWSERFSSETLAFECEKKIKKWSRKKKEALIQSDWKSIQTLAQRRTRYVKH